jgi:hypothetical protein
MKLDREQWRLVQRMADAAMVVLEQEHPCTLDTRTAVEDAIYDAVAAIVASGLTQTEDGE